ncbi:MAG: PAS domain-containing protein [Pirellulales bacterium]
MRSSVNLLRALFVLNAGAERLSGYSAEEAVGRSITLIIPLERHHEEQIILGRLLRGERIENYETIRVTKQGRRLDISLTVSPLYDASGKIIGAAKVARDITRAAKPLEALLRPANRDIAYSINCRKQRTGRAIRLVMSECAALSRVPRCRSMLLR